MIFYFFTYSAKLISARLKEAKIKHGWIYSGTKDSRTVLRRFDTDPDCRVLLVQNRSGSEGLNLQVARVVIFYENSLSVIEREQAEKRCWRQGQQHRVFQYDLVVRNTVDQRILDFHKEGKDIFKAVIADPMSVIRPDD